MPNRLIPGFDLKRLHRQQKFLLDRAKAHKRKEHDPQGFHRACAASLIRDAAAIALLRNEPHEAAKLFRDAGGRFANLGLFYGFSLLELSGAGKALRWLAEHDEVAVQIRRVLNSNQDLVSDQKDIKRVELNAPFLKSSASSPRQLMHLLQTREFDRQISKSISVPYDHVEKMLRPHENAPIGTNGMTLGVYRSLSARIAEVRIENSFIITGEKPVVPDEAREVLSSVFLQREKQIRAARGDEKHWQMLLKPADLIDFDLLELATMMVRRMDSIEPFREIIGDCGALVDLPFVAAEKLRSAQ